MKNNISPVKADLLLALVAFLWGSSYVITKGAIESVSPPYVLFYRFSIASVLCLIFYRKQIRMLTVSGIKAGALLGVLLSAGILFSISGVMYTTVSKNSFIVSINIVLVPFIYWVLCRKKPTAMSVAAVFLMAVGLGFLTLDFSGSFDINKGDLLSLGCVLFYALHVVLSDIYSKKYEPVAINSVAMITCVVISLFAIFIKGNVSFIVPGRYVLSMLHLGIFTTFLSFTIQIVAQKHTIATHAAIIMSLESVFATTLAVIVLKEKLTLQIIIGGIIIFISVLASEAGDKAWPKIKEKFVKAGKKAITDCQEN